MAVFNKLGMMLVSNQLLIKLFTKPTTTMNSLLYFLAIVLVIGWVFGFFVYSLGGLIHILLVLAVISILLRLIQGRRV